MVVQTEGSEGAVSVDDVKVDASQFGGRVGGAVEECGFEMVNAVETSGGVANNTKYAAALKPTSFGDAILR